MLTILKKVAARLPLSLQQELKRWYFWGQIRAGQFKTNEPEYAILDKYVSKGDWVIDIGANIGHYTAKLSKLTGPKGRVIAVEPVPETFDLLATNSSHFQYRNVTLINAAISDCAACVGIEIPKLFTGLNNYYEAHILSKTDVELNVLCLTIDCLCIPTPIRLIKIDAEGHEFSILNGMKNLLIKDKPVLIIEGNKYSVDEMLTKMGYLSKKLKSSPNKLYEHE